MSRGQKNKLNKVGERYDFRISHLKAVQVPKGWDRLFVSLVSVETGKTVAKTGRAFVRNGSCQWSEVLSDSIWVSQDHEPSQDIEDCLHKLVVSMGSARSGILGEATMDMASNANTQGFSTSAVSLPLKKCNHGTILQLNLQCQTPRTKNRDSNVSKGTGSSDQVSSANSTDIDTSSEKLKDTVARIPGSSSREVVETMAPQEEQGKESSFSTSGSYGSHSYDSVESSPEGTNHVNDPYQSDHLSNDLQTVGLKNSSWGDLQEVSSLIASGFPNSKNLLEVAEKTIEELHAEAKMWKRNAQKLMLDMEILKKEYSDRPKSQANLAMELAAANAERDGLRNEVEQLRILLVKSAGQLADVEDSKPLNKELTNIQKQYMEDEIKFQKESNANLTLQLKKSQDANAELLSALQEQEGTIEQQRAEVKKISALQAEFEEMESTIQQKIEETEKLLFQLERSEEMERTKQAKIKLLEQAIEEKGQNMEKQKDLSHVEEEYRSKLADKEREVATLREKLSESLRGNHALKTEPKSECESDLMREIKDLREKLEDLERDCDELTNENLELLIRIKETNNSSSSEESEERFQLHHLEERLKKKLLREIEEDQSYYARELESFGTEMEAKVAELLEDLSQKGTELQELNANLDSKEKENEELRGQQMELEARLLDLQKQKDQMEDKMEAVLKESNIATKCLNDLQKDLTVLSSSLDSHVSANRILEKKSSELEKVKCEFEMHLAKLATENEKLLEQVSSLEEKLRALKEESNSTRSLLENSKSYSASLEDEITRYANEVESRKKEMIEQLQDTHRKLLESQENVEGLRKENSEMQASAEALTAEYSSLRKSNEELMNEKLELGDRCAQLEGKLRESSESLADCSERVKLLEETLSLVQETSTSKIKGLMLEVDTVSDKCKNLEEKLKLKESSWNQLYFEKTNEVVKLQKEIKKLTEELATEHHERDSAVHEISSLSADKVRLESALKEAESRISLIVSEMRTIKSEAEGKIEDLIRELAAFSQSQEKLKSDYEKVLKSLEHYESEEEKLKTTINDLELKLTVSEYERQKLSEKTTEANAHILRIEDIEEEVRVLRSELNTSKSSKENLEASLSQMSRECQDLQKEKLSLMENISHLQKAATELEGLRHDKVASEEKLLQMESELESRDLLSSEAAELRNELGQTKRTNRQFRQKIQQIEQEKVELLKRSESLEEKLKLLEIEKQNHKQPNDVDSNGNHHQRQDGHSHDGSLNDSGVDYVSKIKFLENELAKAIESSNMYKNRLTRLSTEGRKSQANSPRKQATIEGETVSKERFDRTKSALETELKDIQERYYQMSLRYAEVEEQREELIMKLKESKSEKKWF